MPSVLLRCSFSWHRFCGSLFIVLVFTCSVLRAHDIIIAFVAAAAAAHQSGIKRDDDGIGEINVRLFSFNARCVYAPHPLYSV